MMIGRKSVPVVIPYYKSPKELATCLAALERQTGATTETKPARSHSILSILKEAHVPQGEIKSEIQIGRLPDPASAMADTSILARS